MTIQKQSLPKEIVVISIMTLVEGSFLLVGFLYIISGPNIQSNSIFNLFISAIANLLAIIALLTSISLFASCYGLIREEEWSRRIAIKLSFIGIIIALVHIIFYLFVVNDSKNIMIILFSIVIGCSIVSIYFLYRHNVKAYFNRLKTLENESDNKMLIHFHYYLVTRLHFILKFF